jgi:hypothetical protein
MSYLSFDKNAYSFLFDILVLLYAQICFAAKSMRFLCTVSAVHFLYINLTFCILQFFTLFEICDNIIVLINNIEALL